MKKILFAFLAGILVMTVPTVFALSKMFADVEPGAYYANAVENLAEKAIIKGYPDGTFGPSNSVNRAELAVMLDRLLEHERMMDNQCDRLSAFTAYPWFDTLNEKYTNEFLKPVDISGDIGAEDGKGCLALGDNVFVFMPGQNVFGCHEIYQFDIRHNTLQKALSDNYYCANDFTNIAEGSVTFSGSQAEGGACKKDQGTYSLEKNKIESTRTSC